MVSMLHKEDANKKNSRASRLSLRGVSRFFGQVAAVSELNLEVREGEILSLLGPSGCGKTTLLRLISGLEEPDSGVITIGGQVVAGNRWVPPEKRGVGVVFQDYALFPHMTIFKNIAFGLKGLRQQELKQKVMTSLEMVGLPGMSERYPHELSGGEQQRVALARALAPEAKVILFDEPFSNLDEDLRVRMRGEIKEILSNAEATVVFVTHDQEEALFVGNRVGVLNAGKLEQIGTPETIFHRPATPFVASFIGIADFLVGEVQGTTIVTAVGRLPLREPAPTGTKVQVMMRPDFTDIHPDAKGDGVIVERLFQGIHYLYVIRLDSGITIRSLQHHTRIYPIDTRVAITVARSCSDSEIVYFSEHQ